MKVLIVDDSSFIVLICRQALDKTDHEIVGEAYDGEKAIDLASKYAPDLILMDIALPKKNGFEATSAILEVLPNTKVLAISALDDDWVRDKAIEAGCYDILNKPFEAKDLVAKVEQANQESGDLKYG